MDAMRAAERVASRQYGAISRAQAYACGLEPRHLRTVLREGRWERTHADVYRVRAHSVRGPRGRLLAAVTAAQLALGPAAFASTETAARLWDLDGLAPWDGTVHLTLPGRGSSRVLAGVKVHRWTTQRHEIVRHGAGPRVTTPGRTLRDTVVGLDRDTAVCLLDSALRRELLWPEDLADLAAANARRPGVARSAGCWALADGRAQSPLETRIRMVCVDAGVPPDTLQHRFYHPTGRLIAVGDLWWEKARLLVEADGRGPHEQPAALLYDRHRQNALETACPGIRILRFTWADLAAPDYIATMVRLALSG